MTVVINARPEELAIKHIIETLKRAETSHAEMSPPELISELSAQSELSDAAIRVAMWYLISQHQLELSADQKLHLAPNAV